MSEPFDTRPPPGLSHNLVRGLIVVGACYHDTIYTVPQYPEEDGKLRASSVERRAGGNGTVC
jgi:hypothetical protein